MSFRRLHLLALLTGAALPACGGTAFAASAVEAAREVSFNIPPGDLGTALRAFGAQSGTEIIFSATAVQGRRTRGVRGRLDPHAALGQVLAGTGFAYLQDGSGALLVRPDARMSTTPVAQPAPPASPGSTADALNELSATEAAEPAFGPDIFVTAQRRQQRAADVPISMNVFDRDTVENRRLNSVEDLAQLTPGLDVFAGNGTNNPTITLRGVGTTNPFLNNNPSVAAYLNDVYLPFSSFLSAPLYDLERIEVLKGPQVALYGRNATAGAINIITARPTHDFSGYVDLTYGSHDYVEARAAVSGPLGESVRVRIAGIWQDGGGYMYRPGTVGSTAGFRRHPAIPGVPAVPAENDYGGRDTFGLRATVAIEPTANFDVTIIAHYGADNSELVGSTNINGDRLRVFRPPSDAPYVDYDNVRPRTDSEVYGISAQARLDLGDVTLTSITGYNRIERRYSIGDFVPLRIAEASFNEDVRSLSQELRLAYVGSDAFTGIVGASYNDDRIDYSRVLLSYDFLLGALGTDFEEHDRAGAIYADGEWQFSPGWFLAGGLRYTVEDRAFDGGSFDINPFRLSRITLAFPGLVGGSLFGSRTYDEDDLSGRLALNWRPHDDLLVYAGASRGFKSGGFDGSGVTTRSGFDPFGSEHVWAYEAGVKASPIEGVYFSVAGFLYDYSDKQVLALIDLGGGINEAVIQNAAAAEIRGIEAELRIRPVRGLTLNLNATLLDSEVTEFVSADPNETASRVGNELPGTPEFQLTAGADYGVPLGDRFMLNGALWANHVTGAYRDIENNPALRSQRRTVVNTRVTLADTVAGWAFYAFAENLFDERYVNSVRSLVGMLGRYHGAPRTAGVGLRYDF